MKPPFFSFHLYIIVILSPHFGRVNQIKKFPPKKNKNKKSLSGLLAIGKKEKKSIYIYIYIFSSPLHKPPTTYLFYTCNKFPRATPKKKKKKRVAGFILFLYIAAIVLHRVLGESYG